MTMQPTPHFVFRCDAGPRAGAGHFMRQLAVAQHAKRHGSVTILVPSEGRVLLEHLDPEIRGFVLHDQQPLDEAAWMLETFGPSAIYVVDSYRLPPEYYDALARRSRCVVFDDGERDLPAALTVRPRPGSSARASVLEGCAYIPVRQNFSRRTTTRGARNLIVSFGASDPTGATATALSRLPAETLGDWRLTVVRGPLASCDDLGLERLRDGGWTIDVVRSPDMPSLLATADAAVVAAGSIVWELAAVGVPTAAFAVVDNQARNARWLSEHRCIAGGWRLGARPIMESADLIAFLTNAQWRESLVDTLSGQIDGSGGRRVVEAALALDSGGSR